MSACDGLELQRKSGWGIRDDQAAFPSAGIRTEDGLEDREKLVEKRGSNPLDAFEIDDD